jgi:signal transduction histidine kinase/ActR/RegA family two-component response regulator
VQWFGTNTDVQYRRDADRALQQHADTLEIINRIGIQLTGELELERLVQAITDAATQVTRAQVGAFIYNRVAQQGDSYMVYTLPGAAREVSGPVSLPRNTPVASAIFRGEGPIRSDDITADERYGKSSPFHGMSLGHLPVRSYLAVPVKSRAGEVLGGLFFGHAESGIFTEQSQRIVGGIAAQAAIAIDNARLYARQQEVLDSERAARAEAERLSRMKDEFLTVLSHELRTPLNAIVGWAHMLAGQRLPPERQQHALESILRNAKAQSRLIEDLLDMSRIISGRLSLEMTELDLRDVIDAAVSSVQPLAAAKHVVLRVERHAEPLLVRGDSGRLQQTLWNLLTNAVKFTPSHGRVTITSREEDDGIELSIADTGIGIAPEFLPHVFDRFRQEDASFTRGHGGLGLGLSIVRSLVELHGGRVSVTSAGSEQGATFTITLPRAVQARAPGQQPAIHDALARATGVRALDNVLVLVVEDDSDARELTAEILKQHGARVTLAASAADALELLAARRIRPDLIISDLGMPEIDGYEFVQRLRTGDFGLEDVPKIALTAYASAGDQVRAAQAGFHVHLAKPFEPQQLVAACVSLLNPATR